MTNDIKEMFVVEWSPRQRSYHFETVGEMLENNLRATLDGKQTDYLPIYITRTKEEARRVRDSIEARFHLGETQPNEISDDEWDEFISTDF
jgi:hypothetical protein